MRGGRGEKGAGCITLWLICSRAILLFQTEVTMHSGPPLSSPSHTFLALPHCSRAILLSQTDVTMRAQLEMAMAKLTESQLNMLSQVWTLSQAFHSFTHI